MTTNDTTSTIVDRARELVQDRVRYVQTLGQTQAALSEATAALERAQEAHRSAWSDAVKVGWSDRELREIGVDSPGKPRRSTASKTRKRRVTSEPESD